MRDYKAKSATGKTQKAALQLIVRERGNPFAIFSGSKMKKRREGSCVEDSGKERKEQKREGNLVLWC
jgi:hypothetical protein